MDTKNYSETPRPESEKISDATATYTATPSTKNWKPAAATHRIAGLEANDEVWQFAQQHQLLPHLETSIRLARETFKDLRGITLRFEPDPEIPSLDGIGIRVKARGSVESLFQEERAFDQSFLSELPAHSRGKICLFVEGE